MELNNLQEKIQEKMDFFLEMVQQQASNWPVFFKITVMVFSFSASIILGFILLVYSDWVSLNNFIINEESLKDQYVENLRRIAALPADREYLDKLKFFLVEDLFKTIPPEENIAQVLKIINSSISSNRLQLLRLTPLMKSVTDFYVTVPFLVEILGDFSAVRKMCQELVQLKRFMHVDLIAVSSEPSGVAIELEGSKIQYTLRISSYYMHSPDEYKKYF